MKKSILSSLIIAAILLLPLLLKTFGISSSFVDGLVSGLPAILIFLIILNCIGLICLVTVKKFATYIDTKDLLEESETQKKIENHIAYKIYKGTILTIFFVLLMYNKMYLTTIFACIWWLSNHFFKINFEKFTKDLEG